MCERVKFVVTEKSTCFVCQNKISTRYELYTILPSMYIILPSMYTILSSMYIILSSIVYYTI